jgi:predicted ATP-grasp superfamily ATP-dependent carboligase
MSPKVVIIGHSYVSRLALARSLGQVGYEVAVIVTMYGALDNRKPLDCYSKYVSEVCYCRAKDEAGLIKILLERFVDAERKVVLIPDSDFSASFVDKNKELLEKFFLFPHIVGNDSYVSDWMDKSEQKRLAREIGLPVANSTVLHVETEQLPDLEPISCYPCFTKSLKTMGGGKQCFRKCDDEEELSTALRSFAERGFKDILVEDFIEIEREYAVVGLSDGQNVIIPGVLQFVENCKSHQGIARQGRILPVSGFENLIALFKDYARSTGFVGLFDIDFLYAQGQYYFCEMNFRFGGSGYAYTKSGVNLPAMFVTMMTKDQELGDQKEIVTSERKYVNERMLVDDMGLSCITINEYNRILRGADIRFIRDPEDPCPGRHFRKEVIKAAVKSIIKRL